MSSFPPFYIAKTGRRDLVKLRGLAPKNVPPPGDFGRWRDVPGVPSLLRVSDPPASSPQDQHRGSEVPQAVPGCSGDVQVPTAAHAQALRQLPQPDTKGVPLWGHHSGSVWVLHWARALMRRGASSPPSACVGVAGPLLPPLCLSPRPQTLL